MKSRHLNMIIISILLGIGSVYSANDTQKDYFNILSVDGGGIRGLISAMVIKNMEIYSYEYAVG